MSPYALGHCLLQVITNLFGSPLHRENAQIK